MSWAQIMKAINSNLMKPLDVLIEEVAARVSEDIKSDVRSYGAPKSTALSTSTWTNSRAAKLDNIGSSMIKRVQRGQANFYSDTGGNAVTTVIREIKISSVDVNKSILIVTPLLGHSHSFAGYSKSDCTGLITLESTKIKQVAYARGDRSDSALYAGFTWQVIEFY